MIPFSNTYTAFWIIVSIIAGYFTLDGILPLSLGFTLFLGSIVMLIACMVSALPDETELHIQRQIEEAEHLDDDI